MSYKTKYHFDSIEVNEVNVIGIWSHCFSFVWHVFIVPHDNNPLHLLEQIYGDRHWIDSLDKHRPSPRAHNGVHFGPMWNPVRTIQGHFGSIWVHVGPFGIHLWNVSIHLI